MRSIIIYLATVIGIPVAINELMSMTVGSSPLIISLLSLYLATFFVPGVTSMLQEQVLVSDKSPYLAPSEEMSWVMVIFSVIFFLLNANGFEDIVIIVTAMAVVVYRFIEHCKKPNKHMYAGIYPLSVVFTIVFKLWCIVNLSLLDTVTKEQIGFLSFTILGLTGISLITYGELTRRKR